MPDDRKFGYEIVEASGHQIMMDNPVGFLEAMQRFID
jgi:pimeloyl-ACP methyl ester carboxylesterase